MCAYIIGWVYVQMSVRQRDSSTKKMTTTEKTNDIKCVCVCVSAYANDYGMIVCTPWRISVENCLTDSAENEL